MSSLMSVADFKTQTSRGAFPIRYHLSPIDHQLQRALSAASNPNEYLRQLLLLVDLCSGWLESNRRPSAIAVPSRRKRRADAVACLRNQACLECKTVTLALRKSASNGLPNRPPEPNDLLLLQSRLDHRPFHYSQAR